MKKTSALGGILSALLILFGLIVNIATLSNGIAVLTKIVEIILLLFVAYYAFLGYKKPHGNLLKWTMLIFSASLLLKLYVELNNGALSNVGVLALTMTCIGYIAGRLNRIEQNRWWMLGTTALFIHTAVSPFLHGETRSLAVFTSLAIWLVLCIAYFARYAYHKEMGDREKASRESKDLF